MTTKRTKYKTYPCLFKWSKVFLENMDKGGDENKGAKEVKKRGGKFSTIMCVSDAIKARMIADGIHSEVLGNQMFKPSDDDPEYPWEYEAKRYVNTKMKDDDGNMIKLDPPVVANLKETYEDENGYTRANNWTYEDGLIGNLSKGYATLSIWTGEEDAQIVTLQKMGLEEVVEYNPLPMY
jgi:hypothetical protein